MDRFDLCTLEDAAILFQEADVFERKARFFVGSVPHYAERLQQNADQIRRFAELIQEHCSIPSLA